MSKYRVRVHVPNDTELQIDCDSAMDLLALLDRLDEPVKVERVGGFLRSDIPAVTTALMQQWCEQRAREADQFFILSTSGQARRLARRAYDTLRTLAKGA